MKSEVSISPNQLRALVLLLLLIPLVPSAALLRNLQISARESESAERIEFIDLRRREFETVLERVGSELPAPVASAPAVDRQRALSGYMAAIFPAASRVDVSGTPEGGSRGAGSEARPEVDVSSRGDRRGVVLRGRVAGFEVSLVFEEESMISREAASERRREVRRGWLLVAAACGLSGAAGWAVQRQLRRDERKGDFLAAVGHELKTPVASMRLLVDTLRSGNLDDEAARREYLGLIAAEVLRLQETIANFLMSWRFDHQRETFHLARVHPFAVVRTAVDHVQPKIDAAGGSLAVNVRPDVPEIAADRRALVTALTNLLDNAVKYSTDDPRVRLDVFPSGGSVFFQVADEGIGVPVLERRRVFERFYRIDRGRSSAGGGCGLGLAIAKIIVETHGGQIGVQGRRGKPGSIFWFRIPIPAAPIGQAAPNESAAAHA